MPAYLRGEARLRAGDADGGGARVPGRPRQPRRRPVLAGRAARPARPGARAGARRRRGRWPRRLRRRVADVVRGRRGPAGADRRQARGGGAGDRSPSAVGRCPAVQAGQQTVSHADGGLAAYRPADRRPADCRRDLRFDLDQLDVEHQHALRRAAHPPYASFSGIHSRRVSPSTISCTPSVHPGIT